MFISTRCPRISYLHIVRRIKWQENFNAWLTGISELMLYFYPPRWNRTLHIQEATHTRTTKQARTQHKETLLCNVTKLHLITAAYEADQNSSDNQPVNPLTNEAVVNPITSR